MQSFELREFNSTIIAAAAGLFVGGIMKLINKLFDRKKDEFEQHISLRKELREELDSVKEEVHLLQRDLDEWKQKYYQQLESTNLLKIDMIRLTEELDEYKRISGLYQIIDQALPRLEDHT